MSGVPCGRLEFAGRVLKILAACAIVAVLVGLLLGAGPTLAPAVPPPQGWSVRGHVTEVVDGDTLEIEVKYRLRVRLLDCWAPESRTANLEEKRRGLASKANLQRLAGDKEVFLFVPTGNMKTLGDLYSLGRVLGAVWVDGEVQSLAERQVADGHASKMRPHIVGRRSGADP